MLLLYYYVIEESCYGWYGVHITLGLPLFYLTLVNHQTRPVGFLRIIRYARPKVKNNSVYGTAKHAECGMESKGRLEQSVGSRNRTAFWHFCIFC